MQASGVEVWIAATQRSDVLMSVCPATEREEAGRFRARASGERWLAGRGALRVIVGRAIGAGPSGFRFVQGAAGKPFLEDRPDVHFNMSHTLDTVAVALADRPVGIDIEALRRVRRPERLATRLLGPDELARWEAEVEPERTTDLLLHWTRAEALLKATGSGLPGGTHRAVERLTAEGWGVQDLAIGPLVGAVASSGTGWGVSGPHWLDVELAARR